MKPWYLSKTVWFNLAALTFEAAVQVSHQLETVLPGSYRPYFAFLVVAGNLYLRFITTEGLRK